MYPGLEGEVKERVMGGPLEMPLCVIWGMEDGFLNFDTMQGIDKIADFVHIVTIENASHWVQQDNPEEVNKALVQFFDMEIVEDDGKTQN